MAITSAPAETREDRVTRAPEARPGIEPSWRRGLRNPSSLLLVVGTLVGIFALGYFSVLTRPSAAVATVWWPASGLALGLGIHTPRRRLWIACAAVAAVLILPNLAQYGTVRLAVAATFGAALEMAVGSIILRQRGEKLPRLASRRDLAMLGLAVVNAATVYDVTIAATTFASGDVRLAMLQLFSEGPRRAAGMLLVAPLFMRIPPLERARGPIFTIGHIGVAVALTTLVFGGNAVPLTVLVVVPPVMGALWIGTRWLFVEMILVSGVASRFSAWGSGPFSFARYGPEQGATLLQGFELAMAVIVLVVSLTVSGERRVASRARRQDAEELARAGEVQRALRPAELPTQPGWEHGTAAVSARQVGGDFYDLRISGGRAVMTLGDVMGKGAGAGILAAATRTALRASGPERRPSEALAECYRILEDDLLRSGAFVTLGHAVIDLTSGDVCLGDAGHGLTFLVRKDGRDVERVPTANLPLGLETQWSDVSVHLAPGESLLMVSDGVLDRWGGALDELTDAIRRLRSDPAISSPQELADALCAGSDAAVPDDDVTAVMFHRQGGRS
ncbi:MAG TPA: SpoIIE family protein phosphatase [Propionibacteriaceae bacterium]|nr:SpoIIE family protein phosphatase [Propionibacteriaceae bacterium]